MTRASIIIPALDEEKNLLRVLPAVLAQMGPSDEVIVVDNGSSDNTVGTAVSFNVKIVAEPLRGRSRARNAGLRVARGAFIVFLDADCVPDQGWLEDLLAPLSSKDVGCSGGGIVTVQANTPLSEFLRLRGHLSQTATAAHSFLPFAQTGNVAFRRSVIEEIGDFDESLNEGEDADLCWRMQLHTKYQINFAASAVVTHMHCFSPRSLLRQKLRHARGSVMLFKKYQQQWKVPAPTWKSVYWEYRSIVRRAAKLCWRICISKFRPGSIPSAERYQLLLEIGEKLGRLTGSIQHRVWFP